MRPRLNIYASGSDTGGGSGFEKLFLNSQNDILKADIVAVISNHEYGGVRARAEKLGVHFIHLPKPWTAERYHEIQQRTKADFTALSGWLKPVSGLDPKTTFNIHPGPLPTFGGKGLYGHHVHEAVLAAYHRGEITHSAVSMHFVTERYDEGPVFFELQIEINPADTAKTLGERVNRQEHIWQSKITNKVLQGEIHWDGKNPNSLVGAIKL